MMTVMTMELLSDDSDDYGAVAWHSCFLGVRAQHKYSVSKHLANQYITDLNYGTPIFEICKKIKGIASKVY